MTPNLLKITAMESQENLIETDLIIDSSINGHLKETAVWGKFLSIVGFLYSGLIVAGAIFAGSMFSKLAGASGTGNSGVVAGGTVAVMYSLIAGVVFFMSIYLFRFARKTLMALAANDQELLIESFRNLKIYFRFAGIITIIALIFSVLGIIGILMATAFSRGG